MAAEKFIPHAATQARHSGVFAKHEKQLVSSVTASKLWERVSPPKTLTKRAKQRMYRDNMQQRARETYPSFLNALQQTYIDLPSDRRSTYFLQESIMKRVYCT